MVNRWYDPAIGRFTQTDPIGLFNETTYAGNNPVNFTDPLGAVRQPRMESVRVEAQPQT